MTTTPSSNPYQSPTSTTTVARTPSVRAILGIVVVSLIAGFCTFFCTCFGIGLVAINVPGGVSDDNFILAACGGGAVVASLVTVFVARAVSRRVTNQHSPSAPATSDEISVP